MKPKDWTEFYEDYIKDCIDRWPGLFILTTLLSIAIYFIYTYFLKIDLLKQPIINLQILLIIIIIFSILLWLFIRRVPNFNKNEIGIIIALNILDKELDDELLKLHEKLESIIELEGLKTKIVIKFSPRRLTPKTQEQAYALRKKCDANLIIWGLVEKGNHQSIKTTSFKPICFSYELKLPPQLAFNINQSINSLLKQRKWVITDNNSILDRDYLVQNIEEIALYIIGLNLYFSEYLDRSIDILGRVLNKYKSRKFISDYDKIAISNILLIIHTFFKTKAKALELWPLSHTKEKSLILAEKIISGMQSFQMPGVLLLKAQVEFSRGNIINANMFIDKAIVEIPGDPSPFYSKAFLLYYEGNLKGGYQNIWRALNYGTLGIGEDLVLLSIWYINSIEESPSKSYLNFPLGLIYMAQTNYILAEKCFKEIVKSYNNDQSEIAKKMVYHSLKNIKKLNRRKK